jgi:hypothetical protein
MRRAIKRIPTWASLRYEELLDVRMSDLGLQIKGTSLEERIARLYDELEERHIRLRPHCWLSEEWFAPDGVPGIALPFYLAHPRLKELERRQMLAVEGGTPDECLRILRHETGHTIETAYRLNRRREWRRIFGKASKKYPTYYHIHPASKDFVLHFGAWYAQSHPSEDFAETFAVWLKPDSDWRRRYADWPARRKLEYVDELMGELADQPPPVRSRETVDPLRKLRRTLREHYRQRQQMYLTELPDVYDRALRRIFGGDPLRTRGEPAAAFLRSHRRQLRESVSSFVGAHPYVVDHLLLEMLLQTRRLGLRCHQSQRATKRAAEVMLTVQTKRFLRIGRHKLAL